MQLQFAGRWSGSRWLLRPSGRLCSFWIIAQTRGRTTHRIRALLRAHQFPPLHRTRRYPPLHRAHHVPLPRRPGMRRSILPSTQMCAATIARKAFQVRPRTLRGGRSRRTPPGRFCAERLGRGSVLAAQFRCRQRGVGGHLSERLPPLPRRRPHRGTARWICARAAAGQIGSTGYCPIADRVPAPHRDRGKSVRAAGGNADATQSASWAMARVRHSLPTRRLSVDRGPFPRFTTNHDYCCHSLVIWFPEVVSDVGTFPVGRHLELRPSYGRVFGQSSRAYHASIREAS